MDALLRERRVIPVSIAGERRLAAAEDAGQIARRARRRAAAGLPEAFLEPVEDPLGDLVSRYARTHGPFRLEDPAARLGLPVADRAPALDRLAERGRVLEGEFLPGGSAREWCDAGVLRSIKRRSLAKLRSEVEPVEPAAFARFLAEWQGVARPRAGLDALVSAVEQLQGAPMPASALETEVLPARIERYRPADLDSLLASGEIVWRGLEPLGPADGRVALYLPDRAALLAPPSSQASGELAAQVRGLLSERGALFFPDLAAETGVFSGDLVEALWDLVWSGEVTNDTLAPLRSLLSGSSSKSAPPGARQGVLGRGAWGLRAARALEPPPRSPEAADRDRAADGPGSSPLRAAWRRDPGSRGRRGHRGRILRRLPGSQGHGGGGPGAPRVLRRGPRRHAVRAARRRRPAEGLREAPETEESQTLVLAATDPANPYGAALRWPPGAGEARPQRAAGAQVVLRDGELLAWIGRTETNLLTFLPSEEPARSAAARDLAHALARLVETGRRRAVLVGRVDGRDPRESALAPHLAEAGFFAGSRGYLKRMSPAPDGRRQAADG